MELQPSHIRIRIKLLEGRNFAATDDKSPSHLHCVFQMGDTSMKSVDSTESITNPQWNQELLFEGSLSDITVEVFSVVETQDMLLGSTILLSDDFSESEVDSWCTITDSTNMVVGQLHLLVTLVGDEAGSCSDCSDSPPIVAAPDPPVLPSIPEFTQAAVSSEFTSIEDLDGEKPPMKPAPPAPSLSSMPAPPVPPVFTDEESIFPDPIPVVEPPQPMEPSVPLPPSSLSLLSSPLHLLILHQSYNLQRELLLFLLLRNLH